jgi:flagellar hook-associated protein 2
VNLQQLGFSTDVTAGSETEGLLLLDTTILTEALNSDPDAVVDVFSAYFEGLSSDSQIAYQSSLPSITSAGIYDVEVDTATIQGRFKLSTEATYHPWIALDGSSGDYTLTGAAGYAEQGLALHITYTDALLHSAEVRLKNGVVTQMGLDLEDLLSTSGPLNTLDGSYNDIVTNIEKRIAQEEDRLVHYEALLRQRFVRLDSYMNQMTQLGNYLTQYVANLSK